MVGNWVLGHGEATKSIRGVRNKSNGSPYPWSSDRIAGLNFHSQNPFNKYEIAEITKGEGRL